MTTSDHRIEMRPLPVMMGFPSPKVDTEGRLVVVLTACVDEVLLAGHILDVAGMRGVLLLGISLDFVREAELRRSFALLAAFIRSKGNSVEIIMEHGPDWWQRIPSYLTSDDLLSCCLDQEAPASRRRLHDLLAVNLDRPVYLFSGAEPWPEAARSYGRRLAPWLSSLAVIVGFLILQISVSRLSFGASTNLLLILSLLPEVGLIWLCNSLLS
jgi:hypothetical protein